jgi:hypothetical protein
MSLYNSAGVLVINVLFEVPALGVFQRSVTSLFPAYASEFDTNAYWIGITPNDAAARFVGSTLTPTTRDNIVVNAVGSGSNRFVASQVVAGRQGGALYDTQLSLTNLQTAPQNVTLTLRPTSGPVLTAQRTLSGSGALRASVASLFNSPSVDGWLLVTASAGNVAGVVTYRDLESGGMAAVEMQAQAAETNLFFGHIADLDPWWTGVALVNSSDTTAQVEVFAVDAAGNLIGGPSQSGTASFAIAGQSKKTFLLSDVVPATQNRATDSGYIFVRSTNGAGLYGTALFFLRSGRVYSTVPATSLSGLSFTPPVTPSTNAVQVSVAPASVTIQTEGSQQFLTAITGSTNNQVAWSVNSIVGGNALVGRISPTGLYTAPASLPDPNPVTITATSVADATKTGSATVVIVPFVPASTARSLTITSAQPPAATVNAPYVFNFTASGGRPPYTWSAATTMDIGMTLDRSTGILSGTPSFTGSVPLTVEVTDGDGLKQTVQYEIKFGGFGATMFITNAPLPGTEGTAYSFKFTTSWSGVACTPAAALVSGVIPPGLVLDGPNLTLSGTPLVAGSYTFSLIATGGGSNCLPAVPVRTNVQTFTLLVNKGSQPTRGASNWVRASDFPVIQPTPGAWDGFAIRSASVFVVYANDTYRLYYEGEDSQTHTRQIGLATSPDGRSWTKSPANPILRPGPFGSPDGAELRSPIVIFDGSTYRMWYSGIDERNGCASVMMATSPDGVIWIKSSANPLNLSNCDYIPGGVIRNAGTFLMWYSRKQGGIGLATSPDGVQWTDRGTVVTNTTDAIVSNPWVVWDPPTYRMWFNLTSTIPGSGTGPAMYKTGVGFATSSDGLNWTILRDADNNMYPIFVPGSDGAWDRPGIGQPSVVLDPNDSLFKMWYVGGPITGTQASGSIGLGTIPQ